MSIKVGDIINYSFFVNIKVVAEDSKHFTLEDASGNTKRVYKSLVNKHGSTVK